MTTHKHLVQELKRPDTFQEKGLKLITWATQNQSKVALMFVPVLVVAGVGYGVYFFSEKSADTRRKNLSSIMALVTEEQNGVSKNKESMQKEVDTIRSTATAKKTADGKPGLPTAEEMLKISELEKKMADLKPDHGASTAKFKEFYDKNPATAEGWMAGLTWSRKQLDDGKLSEARPVIEAIVKASTAHKLYQIQSRFMLANVLDELGEFDTALKETEVLVGLVDDDAKAMVLLMKGQIQYFKKDFPSAKSTLGEIVEKHGSTREASLARALISEIGSAS